MNLRSSFPKSRDSRSKKTVKMVAMETRVVIVEVGLARVACFLRP